ncbi:GNAT family N-acetyltransferase [Halobacterium sp. KA-4]|jgi:tRNA(Met) cytidine acetyltransferase|uniref:tRNA(Met) cytidine acetyltransferase TmcA n=1 Tax=Halobacterium sp. KA-4 TaxID=2896367 RepID=UPI001E50BF95|nr:tRNA(Met) cytidine acetyltransferase TmcA [Halobacterium sp. KA-4]MCD2199808.1 GNAT family N-acetyltransferase [Halobacterium sp. KA-4]
MVVEAARTLHEEAQSVNERRVLVLTGDREACLSAADRILDTLPIPLTGTTLVSTRDALACEQVGPRNADELLGTTRDAVVFDAYGECRPNALGRVVGAVDGGGLLLVLAPALDEWPSRHDAFDEGLAVPPFDVEDVAGRFRRRLVETLRTHPGIAIYDVDADTLERDGLTNPAPRIAESEPEPPADRAFPHEAYAACLTDDQMDALAAFEGLRDPPAAVVAEADRGRGKSSAAGLAAACLAKDGLDVLVTAPGRRSASELFARARELLGDLDALAADDEAIETDSGGRIRFAKPPDAADLPDDPNAVFADEAAAIPVRLLKSLLECECLAFTTTVHGYEGAGRGFDVRFRDRLANTDHEVTDVTLAEPIRYAAGDPVEVWAFRALLLDARPAVDPLVEDATTESVTYEALTPDDLLADENLLREVFGLLVYAHYRTEPNDLARLLDAPNLAVRALVHDGHVVSVALLAREGGLDADLRAAMYEGERVKGNMIPDVLTSQLRDEDAAIPVGYRVMRIATHHAARSRGLGSQLLGELRAEYEADADWLGVGYGATPELLSFWRANGYSTVHLSTTRNDTSGEYSAVMLDPLSHPGERLHDRHAGWFADRIPDVLADSLRDLDPDVARAALRACDADQSLDLADSSWRVVAGAAHGPGMYSVDPAPFRRLARHHLVAGDADLLAAQEERLVVAKLLQARPWDAVADSLDFHSTSQAMRALGDALRPLVDAYGTTAAREELARFTDED